MRAVAVGQGAKDAVERMEEGAFNAFSPGGASLCCSQVVVHVYVPILQWSLVVTLVRDNWNLRSDGLRGPRSGVGV